MAGKSKLVYYQDRKGEWRWKLLATNGQIVAVSGEGYVEKRGAEHGYQVVKKIVYSYSCKVVYEPNKPSTGRSSR